MPSTGKTPKRNDVLDEIAEVTHAKSKTGTLNMTISEQCFLISNIKTIAENKASGLGGATSLAGGSLAQKDFLNSSPTAQH